MIGHIPAHAGEFLALFARAERALSHNGYARRDRGRAVANWRKFAKELSDEFFAHVRKSNRVTTLLIEPPRVYYRGRGFLPTVQKPITDVEQLFARGVCQVRHNIVHGEKYVEFATPRDDALVTEANWVLEEAIARHPKLRGLLDIPQSSSAPGATASSERTRNGPSEGSC